MQFTVIYVSNDLLLRTERSSADIMLKSLDHVLIVLVYRHVVSTILNAIVPSCSLSSLKLRYLFHFIPLWFHFTADLILRSISYGQMAVQNWTEINQRLNRFGATQFTAELGSNSDLTRVQSWTTLVQRALSHSVAVTTTVQIVSAAT